MQHVSEYGLHADHQLPVHFMARCYLETEFLIATLGPTVLYFRRIPRTLCMESQSDHQRVPPPKQHTANRPGPNCSLRAWLWFGLGNTVLQKGYGPIEWYDVKSKTHYVDTSRLPNALEKWVSTGSKVKSWHGKMTVAGPSRHVFDPIKDNNWCAHQILLRGQLHSSVTLLMACYDPGHGEGEEREQHGITHKRCTEACPAVRSILMTKGNHYMVKYDKAARRLLSQGHLLLSRFQINNHESTWHSVLD
ncbi:hypothetical protein MCOR29_010150 [Pyricularia oryzae]|nr:hypothetical protein MCOR29_010150 [Pyricularia oryzae]KAI6347848.1 hypothetical protein MCOR28_002018 [Pyricularia oryzae]KAI6388696.1 hypothetical protein MCOR32_000104 [Pyricularia oryzae]KAI6400840.1 hypothetical protein MCOR20_008302 [Pyricularia oryzae]KAI6419405.1 hypothetical protein MCOR21_010290 [Pyricularia oryzae]